MTTHHHPTARPLRIALVTGRFEPGTSAVATHTGRLAAALGAAGHEVTVLTHDLDGRRPERERVDGIDVVRFAPLVPGRGDLASPALARHLAHGRTHHDVVHVHGDDATAALVAHWWTGPFVLSPHLRAGAGAHVRAALHLPHRLVGRRALARADAVVCTSAAEREAVVEQHPTALARTTVIAEGIDVAHLRAAPADRGDGRPSIVVLDRLEAHRRVDLVLSAFALLDRGLRLDVCGDGAERAALEQQAVRLGLLGRIRFQGLRDEVARAGVVRAASCLVTMASFEEDGGDLLRAAAVGTPSVASAVEAHSEARHRAGAVVDLVPPDADAATVAQAIDAARLRYPDPVDLPTWDDVAARVEGTYRAVVGRRAHCRGAVPA